MKKLFLSLIVLLCLFSLTGCGNNVKKNEVQNTKDNEVIIKINDEVFKLKSEANLKDLHYRENYVDFHTDAIGKMRTMSYSKNGELVFEVRLLYEDEHSFDEVNKLIEGESQIKKINGIDYTYHEYTKNGNIMHVYLHNYKNITYTIIFALKKSMDDFEKTYMNNVYFE